MLELANLLRRRELKNMDVCESVLKTPENFPFPFTPYSIQNDFMRNLYKTLEEKKLGIFESPTGTGKSMSLICGALKWLRDAQERVKEDSQLNLKNLNEELNSVSSSENWLEEHASKNKRRQKRDELQIFHNKILNMESRIENIYSKAKAFQEKRTKMSKYRLSKSEPLKDNVNCEKCASDNSDEEEVLLNEFEENPLLNNNFSDSDVEGENEEKYYGIKLILCSRTHSQLSQLVTEIQKSPYKDMKIRVVTLASRQNYCINESVLNLKHLTLINERCETLRSKKKKGRVTKTSTKGETLKRQKTAVSSGCSYYNQSNIENLKLNVLTEIQDVEQIVGHGKEFNGCPYYAARLAVDDAQIIIVPYNTILHKNTREASGINLKDSVVIIDEAHNLLDSIGQIYSCTINGFELTSTYSHLMQYKDKFSDRFSPINLLHLNQVLLSKLIFIVNKLIKKIGGKADVQSDTPLGNANQTVTVETLAEFILSSEIDTINFYKVLEFVKRSDIVNKLKGYVEKYKPSVNIHKKCEDEGVRAFLRKISNKENKEPKVELQVEENTSGQNFLFNVTTFIQSLTNHCLDGRIISSQGKTVGTSSLKFLLLNPASHFSDIVKEARSVVLVGGTMQPMSEFTDQLFYLAGGSADRINIFSCDHIIPKNNILPIIVSSGPSGKVFDFSYQQRSDLKLLDELGRLLINVCNVVPAGVVCFFPSYEYENFVFQYFEKSKIILKLQNKKKVLREPKKSNEVDEVLKKYSGAVEAGGALLFSVVGGKLSEGLNFNDDLGRCIIVVGLPYPNLTSPELKEKMNYLEKAVGPTAGKTYYENLCMKAVNQSIGRSVRHKDDYASVLLLDQRYSRPKCVKALPEWIQRSLRIENKFGPAIGLLAKFFSSKKGSQK